MKSKKFVFYRDVVALDGTKTRHKFYIYAPDKSLARHKIRELGIEGAYTIEKRRGRRK